MNSTVFVYAATSPCMFRGMSLPWFPCSSLELCRPCLGSPMVEVPRSSSHRLQWFNDTILPRRQGHWTQRRSRRRYWCYQHPSALMPNQDWRCERVLPYSGYRVPFKPNHSMEPPQRHFPDSTIWQALLDTHQPATPIIPSTFFPTLHLVIP